MRRFENDSRTCRLHYILLEFDLSFALSHGNSDGFKAGNVRFFSSDSRDFSLLLALWIFISTLVTMPREMSLLMYSQRNEAKKETIFFDDLSRTQEVA